MIRIKKLNRLIHFPALDNCWFCSLLQSTKSDICLISLIAKYLSIHFIIYVIIFGLNNLEI